MTTTPQATETRQANDFWTTVVLELRQPMTAVSGQVQRAQHLIRTDPKSASEAMKEVVAQIERIDRILDELHERVGTSPIPATARGHRPARQEE